MDLRSGETSNSELRCCSYLLIEERRRDSLPDELRFCSKLEGSDERLTGTATEVPLER